MISSSNLRLITTDEHNSSLGVCNGPLYGFEKLGSRIAAGWFPTLARPRAFIEAIYDEGAIRDVLRNYPEECRDYRSEWLNGCPGALIPTAHSPRAALP